MKKSPVSKERRVSQAVARHVLLEHRRDAGQVESPALEVRVGEGDLDGQVALGGADVDEARTLAPGEPLGDLHVRAMADPGHGREEALEPGGVGVERLEQRDIAGLRLVLEPAGAQRLGQGAPEAVEAVVRHLEDPAGARGAPGARGGSRARVRGRLSGWSASSVKSPISMALRSVFEARRLLIRHERGRGSLRSVFEAQKPRPTCMMWSGAGCVLMPGPPLEWAERRARSAEAAGVGPGAARYSPAHRRQPPAAEG